MAAVKDWIHQLVEKMVSQVLESHIPTLREELVRRVVQELQPAVGKNQEAGQPAPSAGQGSTPPQLLKAISSIHQATAQKEILAALLDGVSGFCSRTALFVVRSGSAVGWQGRGFSNPDAVKNFALGMNSSFAAKALQEKKIQSGPSAGMDKHFLDAVGAPEQDQALMLPLVLKEKVAGLLYADAGPKGGKLDAAAVEMLVLSAGLWLEVVTLRRSSTGTAPAQEGMVEQAPVSAKTEPVAVQQATPAVVAPPVAVPVTAPEPEPPKAMAAAAAASPVQTPPREAPPSADGGMSDEEVHKKAKRFAKLLVDEIKLYNKDKVAEGRKKKDLYTRLKEDIDKSRATYDKRYGKTAAAEARYFDQEIVRILAENDKSLLGANYSQ